MHYIRVLLVFLLLYSVTSVRLSVFNPEVFFVHPSASDEVVRFTLTLDDSIGALLQENTPLTAACFQLNGIDCHCFKNIQDISTHAFKVPPACKVFRSQNTKVWFSVKLRIADSQNIISTPISLTGDNPLPDVVTLVLPLTLDDLSRAALLASTLCKAETGSVSELIVLVPDQQQELLEKAFVPLLQGAFAVRVLPESSMFSNPTLFSKNDAYTYSIQMALKLLVARHVYTQFYITLDADVLLIKPSSINETIRTSVQADAKENGDMKTSSIQAFGIYEDEKRQVHEDWWLGSAAFLGMTDSINNCIKNPTKIRPEIMSTDDGSGFSVTPAVLSTFGSIVVLQEIMQALIQCYGIGLDQGHAEILWVESLARESPQCQVMKSKVLWSEYTLYRLALDNVLLFADLHEPQYNYRLHCHDIWYAHQLPWDGAAAATSNCLFSVVQGSTGVSPSKILLALKLL